MILIRWMDKKRINGGMTMMTSSMRSSSTIQSDQREAIRPMLNFGRKKRAAHTITQALCQRTMMERCIRPAPRLWTYSFA